MTWSVVKRELGDQDALVFGPVGSDNRIPGAPEYLAEGGPTQKTSLTLLTRSAGGCGVRKGRWSLAIDRLFRRSLTSSVADRHRLAQLSLSGHGRWQCPWFAGLRGWILPLADVLRERHSATGAPQCPAARRQQDRRRSKMPELKDLSPNCRRSGHTQGGCFTRA